MSPPTPETQAADGAPPAADPSGAGALPAPRVGLPAPLDRYVMDLALVAGLTEDRGAGDLTSQATVPAEARAQARLVAKEPGVMAGIDVFVRAFRLCDWKVESRVRLSDGDRFDAQTELAVIQGNARALLQAERTALNLVQRMCGIATKTAYFVDLVSTGSEHAVRILDTRKTTPGLRALEKYSVRCGGGENHRFGLFDEVMIKENHVALGGGDIGQLIAETRRRVGPSVRITAEAGYLDEARAAVCAGADVVMLDNMGPAELSLMTAELRDLAGRFGHTIEIEASGGVNEESLVDIASSGVDRISVGALTHSVRALDLSVYMEPLE